MLTLTGCPAGGSSSNASAVSAVSSDSYNGLEYSNSYSAGNSYFKSGGTFEESYVETGDDYSDSDSDSNVVTEDTGVIDTEMLIYRGNVRIKTENFAESVAAFKADIKALGGFIESQDLDTGLNMYDTRRDLQEFVAVVRIPSSAFHDVMDGASKYGKIIHSTTEVENIAQEYASTSASLEVYETKRKRYLELMSRAENMSDMVELEREVTNIESQIASYKSALSVMDTDVAYSTLTVTISNRIDDLEVADDTFISRLSKAFKDSFRWFVTFIENVIIWVVLYWWYIALLIVLIILIKKWIKRYNAKHPVKLYQSKKSEDEPKILRPDDFEGIINVTDGDSPKDDKQ